MRPLSLATFAAAELNGCGLDSLLNSEDEEQALEAWILLYAFLRGDEPEKVALEVHSDQRAFTAFVEIVQASFQGEDSEEAAPTNHRRSKDPRGKIKAQDGRSMKEEAEETDYSVLFDLARYSKIPLSDIYGMTFRGLVGLTQNLSENPPMPSMFGE